VIAALAQVAARCMGTSARPLPDDLVAAAVAAAAADGDEADLATLTLDLDRKDSVGRLEATSDILSIPDIEMVFSVVLRIHLNAESGSNWARWFTDHLVKGLGDAMEAHTALQQQHAQQLLAGAADGSDHADAVLHAQELLDTVNAGMRRLWLGDKHKLAEFVVDMAPTHVGAANILGSLELMIPSELELLRRSLEAAAQQPPPPPPPPPPPFRWAPPAAADNNNNNNNDNAAGAGADWRATAEQLRVENAAQALQIGLLQRRVADLERQLAEARGEKPAAADAGGGEDEEWVDDTDNDDDS
jgi:hypothetical protein